MNRQSSSPFTVGSDIHSIFKTTGTKRGFAFTLDDPLGVLKPLRRGGLIRTRSAPLLARLLRHKLPTSRGAVEPASPPLDDLLPA